MFLDCNFLMGYHCYRRKINGSVMGKSKNSSNKLKTHGLGGGWGLVLRSFTLSGRSNGCPLLNNHFHEDIMQKT